MEPSPAFAPFRITVCGIEELGGFCEARVTHVLSILDPGWPEPDSLSRFDINRRLRLRFHDVIESQPGWIAPERWRAGVDEATVARIDERVEELLEEAVEFATASPDPSVDELLAEVGAG